MYKNRLFVLICLLFLLGGTVFAQQVLSLHECRMLAIENNRKLKKASEQERKAHYEKQEALMKYFPKFSTSGSYLHFSKNLHLISKDAIPSAIPLPAELGGPMIIPQEIKDGIYKATEIDMSGFWTFDVSLTQPLFAGGKIIAFNDIRGYAKELGTSMKETAMTDVLVEVDESYWQVVSLANKTKLAQSYVQLLTKMDSDINSMLEEGMATKADRLSVNVKLNEAEITLTKAHNGLSLSKMLLCQVIGIEIEANIEVADETIANFSSTEIDEELPNLDLAVETRSEVKSLGLVGKIYKKQENIALAEFLPTAGLKAGYNWMRPNLHDGVKREFAGMWNVGVSVTMPLNFISSSAKLKAAKSESLMHQYEVEDTKEKIKLQIKQSSYKLSEATKKLKSTIKNSEKADENLRYANVGFQEGVIPAADALAAHTAWISAHGEVIDAQIDLKLCKLYLDKALGKDMTITK